MAFLHVRSLNTGDIVGWHPRPKETEHEAGEVNFLFGRSVLESFHRLGFVSLYFLEGVGHYRLK